MGLRGFTTQGSDALDRAIGQNIAEVRRARGLSQRQLADAYTQASGETVAASTIGAWERGTRRIFASQLELLACALRCPVTSLYYKVPGPSVGSADYTLSERTTETLEHALSGWSGDMYALLEFCRLYMALPAHCREEIGLAGLLAYTRAAEHGEVDGSLSVDVDYIERAWRTVVRAAAKEARL